MDPSENVEDTTGQQPAVKPISFRARYGAGRNRVLILGGGGVFFVAWQVKYLRELQRHGVGLDYDLLVGTSAGSVVGSIVAGEGLHRIATEIDVLTRSPHLVAALAPSESLRPSQQRALNAFVEAHDAEPETIRAIGHAALAARTASASQMRRHLGLLVAARHWPATDLQITTIDCWSGERLVVDREAGVSLTRAATASSAVPGLFPPQPIGDRFGMDGGVSGTGVHVDLAAGARRVMLLALQSSPDAAPGGGMTVSPDTFANDLASLRASGSEVLARGPASYTREDLMSPEAVPKAVEMAVEQAAADAAEVRDFWS